MSTDIVGTDHTHSVYLVSVVCPPIVSLFVAGRWYTRLRITKNLRWDDYFAAGTLLSNIAYSVLQGISTQPSIGIGRHQSSFPPSSESEYYKWILIFTSIYMLSLLGYKTTILLFYLRIFGIRKHFKWTVWFVMFIVDAFYTIAIIVWIAGCIPTHKFWAKDVVGTCIDYLRFDIAWGSMNIITDFLLAILPLREIWRLFMPIKKKIWASLIFGSAVFAFAAAIISQTYRFHDLFSKDRAYDIGITITWQTIEINIGLICTCTPALPLLYAKAVDTFRSLSSSSSSERKLREEVETEERMLHVVREKKGMV